MCVRMAEGRSERGVPRRFVLCMLVVARANALRALGAPSANINHFHLRGVVGWRRLLDG